MMLHWEWDQSQGLFFGWGVGVGWSSQEGLPGRGVGGPLHGFLLVLTVHLNHHHQAALGFASEWVTGHLKRS